MNTTVSLPFISTRYPIPTTSSSFFQPFVTPSTALKTSARASPCTAACALSGRSTVNPPAFSENVIPAGIKAFTLPLGPSTTTMLLCTVYFTPLGSVMGFLPIRDITSILHGLRVANLHRSFHCSLAFIRPFRSESSTRYFLLPVSYFLLLLTRLRRESRRQHLRGAPDDLSS